MAVTHNTGVEMEALTGAAVAALTIYDMCKALSHDIEIGPVRLLAKSGGRRDYSATARGMRAMSAPLYGLVLAGGHSKRMGRDKAGIAIDGRTQLERAFGAARASGGAQLRVGAQRPAATIRCARAIAQIVDAGDVAGPDCRHPRRPARAPAGGLAGARLDLPLLDAGTLQNLIARRDPARIATAYRSSHDGLPEPLCAIYEPAARAGHGSMSGRRQELSAQIPDPIRYAAAGPAQSAEPRQREHARRTGRRDAPHDDGAGATPRELQRAVLRAAARTGRHGATKRWSRARRHRANCSRSLQRAMASRSAPEHLKVAVNTEFADWSRPLAAGDTVVFIPPVAGG